MKRPTYYINESVKEGELEFPAWTMVQPIEDIYVPDHHKDKLKDARRYSEDQWVMCIIGRLWIPVRKHHITERR